MKRLALLAFILLVMTSCGTSQGNDYSTQCEVCTVNEDPLYGDVSVSCYDTGYCPVF